MFFFFQAEDGIRDFCLSRGLGDVYKRQQYTIQLKDREQRDKLQQVLKDNGIPSMIYYPKPMHKQLAFGLAAADGACDYGFDCSTTESLCDTVLSLPMHPYLKEEEIGKVAEVVRETIR